MLIDEAIKMLQKEKAEGTKAIILAYWKSDMFDREDDASWSAAAAYAEDQSDWSRAHDMLSELMEEEEDDTEAKVTTLSPKGDSFFSKRAYERSH